MRGHKPGVLTLADLDSEIQSSEAFSRLFTRYYLTGSLSLAEEMFRSLKETGILFEVHPSLSESSPQTQVLKHLQFSHKLRKMLNSYRDFSNHYENNTEAVETLALAGLASEIGLPLHLSEFAWQAQLPYLLTDQQISAVSIVEDIEKDLSKTVVTHLASSLNEGARQEVRRIATLGVRTVFPETPISCQILMNSASPSDLFVTALQLRDEYKSFRNEMIALETELLSENASLKRKIKLHRQVELLAAELWINNRSGMRKVATEFSNLLNIVPTGTLSVGNVSRLTAFVLDKPVDFLLTFLRRRKVRVLLKARKQLLNSRDSSSKLATLFDLPKHMVREALYREHR